MLAKLVNIGITGTWEEKYIKLDELFRFRIVNDIGR
jgi:hypothetical protein